MKCDFNGRHDSLAQNQTGARDGISKKELPTSCTQFLSDMSVAVSVSESDDDILADTLGIMVQSLLPTIIQRTMN